MPLKKYFLRCSGSVRFSTSLHVHCVTWLLKDTKSNIAFCNTLPRFAQFFSQKWIIFNNRSSSEVRFFLSTYTFRKSFLFAKIYSDKPEWFLKHVCRAHSFQILVRRTMVENVSHNLKMTLTKCLCKTFRANATR